MALNPRALNEVAPSYESVEKVLYGQLEGAPYEKWPDSALKRLQNDLGRNGVTEKSDLISREIQKILKERVPLL